MKICCGGAKELGLGIALLVNCNLVGSKVLHGLLTLQITIQAATLGCTRPPTRILAGLRNCDPEHGPVCSKATGKFRPSGGAFAKENLKAAQQVQKQQYKKDAKFQVYQPGD